METRNSWSSMRRSACPTLPSDGLWWLRAISVETIGGLCTPSRCIRTGLPACIDLQGHTHAFFCLTHPDKLLAQLALKVVGQNARLPVPPVEQVRQRIINALLLVAGLSLNPILCKANFSDAFVTLMEECWDASTVPSSPSPMPAADGINSSMIAL